jgi:hypothetical protein
MGRPFGDPAHLAGWMHPLPIDPTCAAPSGAATALTLSDKQPAFFGFDDDDLLTETSKNIARRPV